MDDDFLNSYFLCEVNTFKRCLALIYEKIMFKISVRFIFCTRDCPFEHPKYGYENFWFGNIHNFIKILL